uniref:Tectonic family member 1 n=1 Tax=Nothobranchius furzeri TaxID=105023 RepID=A0A1A7Z8B5_NOTFU
MAVSAAVFSILKSLWLFLSITSVASNQSTTNGAFNTTEPNFSHTVTDNYTEFESTPSPGGTENSPVAAEPLPVSGHLLSAKTSADSLCPCDEVLGVCDTNCCCDPECGGEVVLFTSCSLGSVRRLDDIANCSLVSQLLLDVLRGPNYPQDVASFGNCSLDRSLDWVQIETDTSSTEAQGCSIPLSLHLDIEWTKYGTLGNPQAKIVSIKEVIQINTSSLDVLSGGSAVYPIRSSVSFIPVSAPAVPGLRATPTFNAKLPFDFFYPFV